MTTHGADRAPAPTTGPRPVRAPGHPASSSRPRRGLVAWFRRHVADDHPHPDERSQLDRGLGRNSE